MRKLAATQRSQFPLGGMKKSPQSGGECCMILQAWNVNAEGREKRFSWGILRFFLRSFSSPPAPPPLYWQHACQMVINDHPRRPSVRASPSSKLSPLHRLPSAVSPTCLFCSAKQGAASGTHGSCAIPPLPPLPPALPIFPSAPSSGLCL